MMKRSLLLAGTLAALTTAAPAQAEGPMVHLVLKFVKDKPTNGPAVVLDPASCPACVVGHDPGFERDNARETLVELRVPAMRSLELAFSSQPGVRRVLLETTDLPFRREGNRLAVALAPLHGDMVDTGEFSTHIVEPGMVLRFEHADPARLAGDYAGKPLPKVQREAANVLEFAEREAIRETGLGDYVAREGLGVIEIMGFDTNEPHGHKDSPPHMHMHLRWPFNIGTQIGHYYLSPEGLLQHNQAGATGFHLPAHDYAPGEPFTTIDNRGRPAYTQTITPEGWLKLTTPLPGGNCLIRPVGQGFASGASVTCDGHAPQTVQVSDDLEHGVLRVTTGTVIETFRYDRDNGLLLSPTEAPRMPDGTIVPISRTEFPLAHAAATPFAAPGSD